MRTNSTPTFRFTGPVVGFGPQQISFVSFRIGISGIDGPRPESLLVIFTQTGGNSPLPRSEFISPLGAFGPTDGFGFSTPFLGGYTEGTPFAIAFEGTINISILAADGVVVDSFSSAFKVDRVAPTPEPATIVLLGLGVTGLGLKLRKRRGSGVK